MIPDPAEDAATRDARPATLLAGARRRLAEVPLRTLRSAFVIGLVAVYGVLLVYTDWLSFPMYRDENQFWRQTTFFASEWPPSLEQIRNYPEPMTPLSFLIWAFQERYFEGGLVAGRWLNLVTSFAMLLVIGFFRGGSRRSIAAAVGLLAFPYFLAMGVHLYTDMLAACFVLLAFRASPRSWTRASFFILAIATRQYMVAFPLALLADEAFRGIASRRSDWALPCLPDAIAASTLAAWIAFFGGLGPDAGLTEWPRHMDNMGIDPKLGLYFLTTVGVYFVLPELLIFGRRATLDPLWTRKVAVISVVLLVLFALDPPIFDEKTPGGFFGRVLLPLPALLRVAVFYVLAWLTCVRFARIELPFWLLVMNLLIILNASSAWEKYSLPLLAAFWMMTAMGTLESGATRTDPAEPFRRTLDGESHA